MAEVLDIISSCITLGQVCMQTATNIYHLFSKAKAVDDTLSVLVDHIDSLAGVLKSIAKTYSLSADHWNGHPFLQHHWENVQQSMAHCNRTMDTLDTLVKQITIERTRSGCRLRLSNGSQNAKAKIMAYKDVIVTFCRSMQISLQLIDLESNAQSHANINTTITMVGGNILNRLDGIENDVKALLESIQSGMTKVIDVTNDDLDPSAKSELVIFIEDGIKSSVDSAQSVVDEIRSSHSRTEMPPSRRELPLPSPEEVLPQAPESDGEDEHDPLERINSPAMETRTIPASILDAISSEDRSEGVNMDVLIIEKFRERAQKKFKEKNYAEAEEHLQEVRRLSERHCGNLYEWKHETTMLRARTLCFMHRWNDVEEIVIEDFKGKEEVLCELAKEYCSQGQTHDAFRLLKRYHQFHGRDETIASIVEDLRLEKRWEAAAEFADVEFVGQERPLEMVAVGCQYDGLWHHASTLWMKVLHCKIARQASTGDTLHALANCHLHLQSTLPAAEWCKEAIQQRLNSVGKDHLLFHHSVNLLARIHLADGNHGDAMAKRQLLGVHFNGNLPDISQLIRECVEWDRVSASVDVRTMVPWAQEDTRHLLRFGEEEFKQALGRLGDHSYIGNGSTFGFLHVFAFMPASLSLLILLDRGADIHATTDIGANLLHVAAAGGDESLIQILCDKGVFEINRTVDGGKKLTALIIAARMGHVPVILKLLQNGADVNERDKDGITALMYAAGRGHLNAVQRLIEKSAKTQARDKNASTALHYAAAGNHVEVIVKLLKNGAEINAVDNDGYSSLFRAVVKGNYEAVESLLSHGADCNLRTTTGWSAVGAAAVERKLDLLELLMMRGWQREASVDPKGRDLFRFAVEEGLNDVKARFGEVEQLRQRRRRRFF